jgi:hypothetical protein
MDLPASQDCIDAHFCAMSSVSRIPRSCIVIGSSVWTEGTVGFSHGSQAASYDHHQSTSRNIEDPHFAQYFAFTCSFLNRMHPFGQACICSYGILRAQRSFCDSYMLFGRMWPPRKHAAKNYQYSIEGISTQAKLRL